MRNSVFAWIKAKNQSSRLDGTVVNDLIDLTIADLYREQHLRYSETSASIAVSAGDVGFALPDRFIRFQDDGVRLLAADADNQATLFAKSKSEAGRLFARGSDGKFETGPPTNFFVYGTEAILLPRPEADATIFYDFDQLAEALDDDGATLAIMEDAWDTVLFGTLFNATLYVIEDGRAGLWKSKYEEGAKSLNAEHAIARKSGGRHHTGGF